MNKLIVIALLLVYFFIPIQTSSFFFESPKHATATIGLTIGAVGGICLGGCVIFFGENSDNVLNEPCNIVNKIEIYREILKKINENKEMNREAIITEINDELSILNKKSESICIDSESTTKKVASDLKKIQASSALLIVAILCGSYLIYVNLPKAS